MTISTIILFYIGTVLSSFVMLKIYEKNSNKKFILSTKNLIKILVISLLCFLNNIFMLIEIRGIMSFVLVYLLFWAVFQDDWKSTLLISIITSCGIQLLDILVGLFLPMWIKNVEVLNQSILFKFGLSVVVSLLLYLLLANKFTIYIINKIKGFFSKSKFVLTIGIIGVIVCNFWLYISSSQTANKSINIILLITEILIFIFVIITLKNNYEKHIAEIKEDQLKQNLDLYSKIASEHKELKHNLMNDFLIIKTKLPKKEQDFMNNIITKYKSNYDWVSDVTDIPEGLQGLVFLKKNQAELKNIKFNLEYRIDKIIEETYKINNNFKLYETLGILFDNAIEGAEISKEKIINVVFSSNRNALQISIFNTFNNDIDLEKLGTKNYSTKNRGSGIGLNYIKRQKNKFKISQSIHDNIFITDIIIEHKEKK